MEIQTHPVTEIPNAKWDGQKEYQKLPSAIDIQAWLVSYLAELLEIELSEVDVTIPFDRYGLDSSAAMGLVGDLEDWLGRELDPTIMYDHPTIEALTQHLAEKFSS
jgi:acyl carrier protein